VIDARSWTTVVSGLLCRYSIPGADWLLPQRSREPRHDRAKSSEPQPATGVKFALATVLGESMNFAGYGWRCPLRTLAEDLGAESGQVTDIFLPRWFADRIPFIFTPPLVIGLVGLTWHRSRRTPL
jgi:hypothetical protein